MAYSKIQIAALHAKLDAVLKQFAAENDLVAGSSRIKYGATDFKVEVQFGDKNANPDAIDPRFLRDLRARGWQVGLDATMIGRPVTLNRGPMKFVGMRASKAVLQEPSGKVWLYDAAIIASMLKATTK